MAKNTLTVSYAVIIQPRTGQQLEEYPHGLTLTDVRPWTSPDASRFPQAEKAVRDDTWCLVFEEATKLLWLIATEEYCPLYPVRRPDGRLVRVTVPPSDNY